MRGFLIFVLGPAVSIVLTALSVLIEPKSPMWLGMLRYGTITAVLCTFALIVDFFIKSFRRKKDSLQTNNYEKIIREPLIDILAEKRAPYSFSDIQHGHVLSTIRIGIKNSGGGAASNCKVYIEKISPEPPLPGGLPILLDGSGFIVRHDDPEKLIDVATHWDHVDKFRFNAPYAGGFAETLAYIQDDIPRTIVIKITASECHRSASFKVWTDDKRALQLEFISYIN
jgi:hypothetical protein